MNLPLFFHLFKSFFVKETKARVLYYLMIFTIITIVVIKFLLDPVSHSIGVVDTEKLAFGNFGVFYLFSSMWMDIIIVIFSLRAVKNDFDFRVASQMLSLPCQRWEYYLAKVSGAWVFSGAIFLIMVLVGATWISADIGINVFTWQILHAYLLTMLRAFTLIIICSFFSLFFSKLVTFATFVFLIPLQSYTNSYFRSHNVKDVAVDLGFFETLGIIMHNIFPRLGNLDLYARDMLVRGFIENPPVRLNMAVEAPHFLGLTLLFLVVSLIVFQKKDIV